jgi:hypothetical protein
LLPEPKDHHLCSVVIVEPDPVIILDPAPAHTVDLPPFKRPTAIRTTRRIARIASVLDPEPELCNEPDPTYSGPSMVAGTQQATGSPAARGFIRMQARVAPFRRSQPNSPVATFTHICYKGQEKTTLQ